MELLPHKYLVEALQKSASGDLQTHENVVIETHISSVLLIGKHAYKIKKPINYGFVDFSTLSRRKHYCEEELRLNSRLAPQLYLGVVPICGTVEHPKLEGQGNIVEYAVKMRRFDQSGLFDQMAPKGQLSDSMIIDLATILADFHGRAESAPESSKLGSAEHTHYWFQDNITHLLSLVHDESYRAPLLPMQDWGDAQFKRLYGVFQQRRRQGFVKACHGDLHLGNIVAIDNTPVVFDCIEFNDDLSWIDQINEIAFLCMDLDKHGLSRLAAVFLNTYLSRTGDYDGMVLFPYFCVYRALVRAKVDLLKQAEAKDLNEYRHYLNLVQHYMRLRPSTIMITHGVSGSGKSYWSDILARRLGFIHIRSDIERKRKFGLRADESSQSRVGSGLYTPEVNQQIYSRLESIADTLLNAGVSATVDATFLEPAQRARFRALANRYQAKFFILEFTAAHETLRERVFRRSRAHEDPSEADINVLEFQLAHFQPLPAEEEKYALECDTESTVAMERVIQKLMKVTESLKTQFSHS